MLKNFGQTFQKHPILIIGAVIIGALLIWAWFSKGDQGTVQQGQYPPGAIDPNVLNANTALQAAQIGANVQNAQTGAAVAINTANNSTASQMQEQAIQGGLAAQTSGQTYQLSAQNSAQTFRNQQSALGASMALNTQANDTYLAALGLSPYAIAALNWPGSGMGSSGFGGNAASGQVGGLATDGSGGGGGGNAALQMATGVYPGAGVWGPGGYGQYTYPSQAPIISDWSLLSSVSQGQGSPFEVLASSGYTPPTGFNTQKIIDWLATGGAVQPNMASRIIGYASDPNAIPTPSRAGSFNPS